MSSRTVSLFFMWAGVAILYVAIGFVLFLPVLMGECLPRDTPETAICDAAKRRDFFIYVIAFFSSPLIAAGIGRAKAARLGMAFLLAASILPLILVIAANLLLGS